MIQNKQETKEDVLEIMKLENLIKKGGDYTEDVTVELQGQKFQTKIRALTSTEWNDCTTSFLKTNDSLELLIVSKGLLQDNGKPYSFELLDQLPAGWIHEIYSKIEAISGQKKQKMDGEQLKQLMGF